MDKHSLLTHYVDMIAQGHSNLLTIRGAPGLGKTTAVLDRLQELGLVENNHYVYLSGHVTPLKLFSILMKSLVMSAPKIFVFDDIDAIVQNKTSVGLLKAALSEARGKRIVSYETSKNKDDGFSPNQFEFMGSVIIIVNNIKQEGAIGRSLLDRGMFYDMTLDAAEISAYVESILPKMCPDISPEEKEAVWNKIKRFADSPNFSLRTVDKALKMYRYSKENWYELLMALMQKK